MIVSLTRCCYNGCALVCMADPHSFTHDSALIRVKEGLCPEPLQKGPCPRTGEFTQLPNETASLIMRLNAAQIISSKVIPMAENVFFLALQSTIWPQINFFWGEVEIKLAWKGHLHASLKPYIFWTENPIWLVNRPLVLLLYLFLLLDCELIENTYNLECHFQYCASLTRPVLQTGNAATSDAKRNASIPFTRGEEEELFRFAEIHRTSRSEWEWEWEW